MKRGVKKGKIMSKYYKAEDVAYKIAKQMRFEVVLDSDDAPTDIDAYIPGATAFLIDLPTIEVSEDCISREQVRAELDYISYAEKDPISIAKRIVDNAPSVVPSRAEGEWIGYEIPSECSVCGHHWDEYVWGQDIWHDGSVPNYCPNCGSRNIVKE